MMNNKRIIPQEQLMIIKLKHIVKKTRRMMIHPKKFKKILLKQRVAKTAQDIFIGIGSWDPAAKEHMMAYDKQLKDCKEMGRQTSWTLP